jgi:hypothetical protein
VSGRPIWVILLAGLALFYSFIARYGGFLLAGRLFLMVVASMRLRTALLLLLWGTVCLLVVFIPKGFG